MKNKRKRKKASKPRSAAISRAASLKGWRTRMRMQQAREADKLTREVPFWNQDEQKRIWRRLEDMDTVRTIDLIPKPSWP